MPYIVLLGEIAGSTASIACCELRGSFICFSFGLTGWWSGWQLCSVIRWLSHQLRQLQKGFLVGQRLAVAELSSQQKWTVDMSSRQLLTVAVVLFLEKREMIDFCLPAQLPSIFSIPGGTLRRDGSHWIFLCNDQTVPVQWCKPLCLCHVYISVNRVRGARLWQS